MVDRRGPFPRQPILLVLACLAAAAGARAREGPVIKATNPPASVRDALAKGNYPWYDARTDAVKPLWPPGEWDFDGLDWLRRTRLGRLPAAGSWVSMTLAMAALTILLVVLARLWQHYQPTPDGSGAVIRGPGTSARLEDLPEGLRPETGDPWSEAVRCRARGDYARAVVFLFAHQLLTLERIRQIRLVPGRTGRQLVRATADGQLRASVEPTLQLFEAVYYGHHIPSAEVFEPVWTAAEAFDRRVAGDEVR
jgi:hypothetical protein